MRAEFQHAPEAWPHVGEPVGQALAARARCRRSARRSKTIMALSIAVLA
jgi:hypothetical protein